MHASCAVSVCGARAHPPPYPAYRMTGHLRYSPDLSRQISARHRYEANSLRRCGHDTDERQHYSHRPQHCTHSPQRAFRRPLRHSTATTAGPIRAHPLPSASPAYCAHPRPPRHACHPVRPRPQHSSAIDGLSEAGRPLLPQPRRPPAQRSSGGQATVDRATVDRPTATA